MRSQRAIARRPCRLVTSMTGDARRRDAPVRVLAQAPVGAVGAAAREARSRVPTRRYVVLDRFGPPEVMRWAEGPAPRAARRRGPGRRRGDRRELRRHDGPPRRVPPRPAAELHARLRGRRPGAGGRGRPRPRHARASCSARTAAATPTRSRCRRDHVFTVLDGIAVARRGHAVHPGRDRLVRRAPLRPGPAGETVLVHAAAGGLGAMTVQLAARPARASSRRPRRPRSSRSPAGTARRRPSWPTRRR